MTVDRDAIKAGFAFETRVIEVLGLDPTVASGNRWSDRGDARGKGLRPSCKANPVSKRSWSQTREQLSEAIEITAGTGQLPLLAIQDLGGAEFVLMRLEDFAELLSDDHPQGVSIPKRSARIRAAAAIPLLRRSTE